MTCYYQSQPGVRDYMLFGKKKGCFSRRAKVVWSSVNDSKERLAVTTAIRGDMKTCRNWWKYAEAQQE